MRRATVRDVRNHFARVLSWIQDGEPVEVSRRGRVVATLVPAEQKRTRVSWPDFLARLRTDWPRGVKGRAVSALIDEGRGQRS